MGNFLFLILLVSQQIKVGINVPLSGPVSSYGKYCLEGMLLRAEMNPEVKLIIEDNEADPNIVTIILRKFVTESISVEIGPIISPNAVTAGIEGKTTSIISILPAATNTSLTKISPLLFRTCFTDKRQGEAIADFLYYKLGEKELQIVADTENIYSTSLALYVRRQFAMLGGRTEIIEISKDTNTDSLVEKFWANIIFLPLYYESVKSIIKTARKKEITSTFIGADGWDAPELFEELKNDSIVSYFSTHYFSGNNNKSREFDSLYFAKHNSCPNTFVALGFDAMNIVLTAIENAKSLNLENILHSLLTINQFEGVTGTFSYEGKPDPQKDVFIIKLQNGKTCLFTKVPALDDK